MYAWRLVLPLSIIILVGSVNVARSQCSAAFAKEAKAGDSFHGRRSDTVEWLPAYLTDETHRLSQSFGLPARAQVMDGAGACINVDDTTVLVGRDLPGRVLVTMKQKLPLVMNRPEFRNRDTVVRAAIRYVVAHEFAHLFQHARANAGDNIPVNEAAFELQADCIAGLWLGYDPSSTGFSGTPMIVATQVAAWVFGDEMGDFPTVGQPEHIDATGHSTGVKRTSCVTSGVGAGRAQRFGDPATAFRDHAKEILDWSAEGAQHYLTPFEVQGLGTKPH